MPGYAVVLDGKNVVLPPPEDPHDHLGFASWGDARAALERVCEQVRAADPSSRATQVVLVPRPDNTYNRYAISVCRPAAEGLTLDDRHLGYLMDHVLRRLGMTMLPRLARHSADGEIRVTLRVRDGGDADLLLPGVDALRAAVEDFLARAPEPPSPVVAPDEKVTACLALLRFPEGTYHPLQPQDLTLAAHDATTLGATIMRATDGTPLGTLVGGLLRLDDERHRAQIVGHLLDLGIEVMEPLGDSGDVDPESVPRIKAFWEREHVQFSPVGSDGSADRSVKLAYYVPSTRTLYAQSHAFVVPSSLVVRRHGLEVEQARAALNDWGADEEFGYHTIHGHDSRGVELPWVVDATYAPVSYRLPHHRATLPRGLPGASRVVWRPDPHKLRGTVAQVRAFEPHFRDRTAVFGPVALGTSMRSCRLCGRPTLEFSAPCASSPLAYCSTCCAAALHGSLGDADDAALALRTIAEREHAGRALLPAQLQPIAAGTAPAKMTAKEIDLALLLRSFIPRDLPWTRMLIDSGLANEGIRLSRGTAIPAADGHACTSMLEKLVDDFLHGCGLEHTREPVYPRHEELNPSGRSRADWLLADGTFVEMWGMPDDPSYSAKMRRKVALAAELGICLVEILPADVTRLEEVFARWTDRTGQTVGTHGEARQSPPLT